jgi:hypothetical protein
MERSPLVPSCCLIKRNRYPKIVSQAVTASNLSAAYLVMFRPQPKGAQNVKTEISRPTTTAREALPIQYD